MDKSCWCFWLVVVAAGVAAAWEFRPGEPTETHSCNHVRSPPAELSNPLVVRPSGLNTTFYKKYTEAYGIPVLGSSNVTDDALMRACYTLRFLLADHSGVRQAFYKTGGRMAIMSATEVTLDIPEHSYLDPWWNGRARGLGGTLGQPLNTGAEENVLCYWKDGYWNKDILVHETAHSVDNIGASVAIPGWADRLTEAYEAAKAKGLWKGTYSMTNPDEYFAEAAMSFFNTIKDPDNSVISTNAELKDYDPELYALFKEVFPCNNTYLERCSSTREEEQNQVLKMNCNTENINMPANLTNSECPDSSISCIGFAIDSECENNPTYMLLNCPWSCGVCPTANATCKDKNRWCPVWETWGECKSNPGYMLPNCPWSCSRCQ